MKDEPSTEVPWLFRIAFVGVGALVFLMLGAVLLGPSDGSNEGVRLLSKFIGAPIGYLLAPYVWRAISKKL
jgi:hypothetical protein